MIRRMALASLILLLALRQAAAQTNPGHPGGTSRPGPFTAADQAINDAEKSLSRLTQCTATVAALKQELSNKKKEITRRYGIFPSSYKSLLDLKFARIQRQTHLCVTLQSGASFDHALDVLRTVEPKSLPGLRARRDRIEELRRRFNELVKEEKDNSSE